MSSSISLIAADDHQLFLEGLKSLFALSPEFNLINTCQDGNVLLELIAQHKPDIALIDISMPGANTDTIVETVELHYPNTRLIAVTMHLEPLFAEKLLKLGLCGYVLKEDAFDELGKAIHAIAAGEQYISPSMMQAISQHHEEANNTKNVLTNREIDVLHQAAKGQTNKEIARSLEISERTARFHIANCCIKLNAHGRSNAVAKALQMALITV